MFFATQLNVHCPLIWWKYDFAVSIKVNYLTFLLTKAIARINEHLAWRPIAQYQQDHLDDH